MVLALLMLAAEPAEIVVTGRGLAAGVGAEGYDTVTIDRDRLAASASGRLEDVLGDVAGFSRFRRSDARSAHPTSQGATLRGLGGNAAARALVLLDGVPQADPFGGWLAWPALDPSRLGSVRVTRGGGSGAGGAGALAGTILLDSAKPGELDRLSASLAYGSRDGVEARAGLAGALGGGFGTLSASYARGDGFVPIVASRRGPIDRAAPYQQASVAGRAVFPVARDAELQASMLLFHDRRERGVPFTANSSTGADASLRLIGDGRWRWEAVAYVQARTLASGFASVDAARTAATATLDQYSVPATGLGGRIELRPPIGRQIELRVGAEVRRTQGYTHELYSFSEGLPTRGRIAGGRSLTAGAFAEAGLTATERLTLTAGARFDRWRLTGGSLRERTLADGATITASRFADRSGWRPTARAAVAWKPAGTVTLRSAAYLGWRLPTLNELYRPYRVGTDAIAANAALSPERLKGADAGVDYRPAAGAHLGVTIFWNRLEDAIANVTLAQGPGSFPGVGFVPASGSYRQRRNLDAIASRGIELDGDVAIGRWTLSGSYAWTHARVSATGDAAALDGLEPAQTPRHQLSATAAWRPRDEARAAATLRWTSGQFEDDQNDQRLRGAVTLDLSAAWPLAHGVSIEARAENVTNARVEAGISGDGIVERATPRTLWLGLAFRR